MRTFKTEGIIIKRRNFGEADRLLTVLTRDYGKLQIKATGVRKLTSRRSSHTELLNHAILNLYRSPAGLPVLTEAQVITDFSSVKQELTTIGLAYHMCELVDGLCAENQENMQVFYLLQMALERLQRSVDTKVLLQRFEAKLLLLLGFGQTVSSYPQQFDSDVLIENIMERKLKSKRIFAKLV